MPCLKGSHFFFPVATIKLGKRNAVIVPKRNGAKKKKKASFNYFMFCCFVMIMFQMLNLVELGLRRSEERGVGEGEGGKGREQGTESLLMDNLKRCF